LKEIKWNKDTLVNVQLWDIAGQERFASLTRMYYKQAKGAFVVFDLGREKTFDAVLKWKADIDAKVTLPNGDVIPVVLLANKVINKSFFENLTQYYSVILLQTLQLIWMNFAELTVLKNGKREKLDNLPAKQLLLALLLTGAVCAAQDVHFLQFDKISKFSNSSFSAVF
jgi:GTPase SAR1 family protein